MRVSALALPLLAAFAAGAHAAAPADGLVDETWGLFDSGRSFVPFDENPANPLDIGRAAVADAEGRTYIVGTVITGNGPRAGITRLGRDGLIDESYGVDGRVVSGYPATGISAALDAEGYLLVGGNRSFAGEDTDFAICRFDPDGNPANFGNIPNGFSCTSIAFDIGGTLRDTLRDIAVQADGKIVLVGDAGFSDDLVEAAVARLDSDGSADPDFGTEGLQIFLANGQDIHRLNAVVIAPNGKIVVAGESVGNGREDRDGLLARLTPTGALDDSFAADGVESYNLAGPSENYFTDLVLDVGGNGPDQAIYAVGASETALNSGRYYGWVTYKLFNGNGTAFFGANGELLINAGETLEYRSIFRQTDGKLVVAGSGSSAPDADTDFHAARLLPVGAIDPGFAAPNGRIAIDILQTGSQDTAYAMAVHPDRFVIAGTVLTSSPPPNLDFAAAALTRDGIFANGVE
jgi:uncharacterized delta-60 repeat protein